MPLMNCLIKFFKSHYSLHFFDSRLERTGAVVEEVVSSFVSFQALLGGITDKYNGEK